MYILSRSRCEVVKSSGGSYALHIRVIVKSFKAFSAMVPSRVFFSQGVVAPTKPAQASKAEFPVFGAFRLHKHKTTVGHVLLAFQKDEKCSTKVDKVTSYRVQGACNRCTRQYALHAQDNIEMQWFSIYKRSIKHTHVGTSCTSLCIAMKHLLLMLCFHA